jgi:hypothetical protein
MIAFSVNGYIQRYLKKIGHEISKYVPEGLSCFITRRLGQKIIIPTSLWRLVKNSSSLTPPIKDFA